MKTIKSLLKGNSKVYVRFENDEQCKAFFQQAEKEGFTFGDSTKPTAKQTADLIAVTDDMELSYVATYGRIAIQCSAVKCVEFKHIITE